MFLPIAVLGPPDVSVSGCGNCLILQLKPPATNGLQYNLQLENLYRGVILHVRRTRDGAQVFVTQLHFSVFLYSYFDSTVGLLFWFFLTFSFTNSVCSTKKLMCNYEK